MHPNVYDFIQLFAGLMTAYGTYRIDAKARTPSGKVKGLATTIKDDVTPELWNRHLAGEQGLGIIPIRSDGMCKFGAIDIDVYPLNIKDLNTRIQLKKLPLVLCRTKSGGAHLYTFLNDPIPAELMMSRLKEMAAALGYGRSEIFPKQVALLSERGDVGSWINMPYFAGGNTTRYALDDVGVQLDVEQFIKYAVSRLVSADRFAQLVIDPEEFLPDGPPCLQILIRDGFPEGTRNGGLFNLAIYAKKAFPDNWQAKTEEYNAQFLKPPLEAREVLGVIKSIQKHDYMYTCKSPPIEAHCNQDRCRRCKFGIGKGDLGMPKMGTLTKLCTAPPLWFIDVEGGSRLELTTEELQSPMMFQRKCMETLNVVPDVAKREDWTEILSGLFENVNMVEVPREATPAGQLIDMFQEFITSRVQARAKEEVLLGKPYTYNGASFFRMKDFIRFLDRQRFKTMDLSKITSILRDNFDMVPYSFRVGGQAVSCFKVKAPSRIEIDPEALPKLPEEQTPV